MTRYNDEQWDMEGDFDDMLRDMAVLSYREGVDRVLTYIESIHAYDTLVGELGWAIKQGII